MPFGGRGGLAWVWGRLSSTASTKHQRHPVFVFLGHLLQGSQQKPDACASPELPTGAAQLVPRHLRPGQGKSCIARLSKPGAPGSWWIDQHIRSSGTALSWMCVVSSGKRRSQHDTRIITPKVQLQSNIVDPHTCLFSTIQKGRLILQAPSKPGKKSKVPAHTSNLS